jgi:hypothetical protein
MVLIDRFLAILGWLAASIERVARGRRWAAWAVVAALVTLSAIPTIAIASSPRPTDLSFEDLRYQRIPAMTSWVRLEGELRAGTSGAGNAYQLVDPADERSYVDVDSSQALQAGHAVLTGQLGIGSNPAGSPGFLGVLIADDPPVPRRDEPFQLILLPALLGIALAIGIQQGYPVIRPERRPGKRTAPLPSGDRLDARWGGWIRNEAVGGHETVACTLTVAPDRDAYLMTIVDARGERTLPVRRRAPIRQVRLCRLDGCRPGLDIRAAGSDLILEFDRAAARDRLASTLL